MYVFYLCMYLFMYVCMYVCRHITAVCRHAGSTQVTEYRSTRVANLPLGQLCTQTSVQLHLYTSGTNNHIPWTHRPTSVPAYVHTRETTKIHRYKGKPKHPCTLRALLRLSMPNDVQVQVQRAIQARGPPRDRCITPAFHAKCLGYPYQILYGYKYSVRVQTREPSRDRCITHVVHAK